MNESEISIVIEASREETWDALFTQYGDIHVHNPTMDSSNYLNDAAVGEVGAGRHVRFSDKLYLEESIVDADEYNSFTVVAMDHNLPFLDEMSATYELSSTADGMTEVKMTSQNSTTPGFMIFLMRGKTVNKANYSDVVKNYA